ncbi:hypothetical protein [Microbacterium paraoxydans]|uniref:hypothetical protein n=1 Tax=Microbacterium paraoxydans TaxID=199592 RepID=UPI003D742D1C
MTAIADGQADDVNDVTSLPESSTEGEADPTAVPVGKPGNLGFDGRVFLTDSEHQTYLRRRPVRYVRKVIPASESCSVCGEDGSVENPLQVAHIVPFGLGVVHFKLTPEWLDGAENLRWAHRRVCNKAAELSVDQTRSHLIELGILSADST